MIEDVIRYYGAVLALCIITAIHIRIRDLEGEL